MKKLFLPLLILSSFSARAEIPALSNVTQTDLDNLSKEFAANFVHTVVAPAKDLGHIWGFEVGVVGGVTSTPELEKIVKRVSPNTTVDKIYHGGAMAMVTVPYGITGEFTMFPEKSISDITAKSMSMGVKWTATDIFPISPWVDLAVRAHYSSASVGYTQGSAQGSTVVSGSLDLDTKTMGMNAIVSSDILLFEPFIGIGFLKNKTDIKFNATGSGTIFNNTVTLSGGNTATSKHSSAHFFAGLQLDLFLFHVAAEYATAFGTSSYTGKFSFYF